MHKDLSSRPGLVHLGCAGWSIPAIVAAEFPGEGSHLERYAQVLPAVEINSSFYRPHRHSTYVRWSQSVPAEFRFSVKLPRLITHELRLAAAAAPLREFLAGALGLGDKLGCLLIQLPPSLQFHAELASEFLRILRDLTESPAVVEPRHASWFSEEVNCLLDDHRVGRVAADPPPAPAAADPTGWPQCVYFRLHGSPRMYYSRYDEEDLRDLAVRLEAAQASAKDCWCIFDNTAAGAAWQNALELQAHQTTHPNSQGSINLASAV
jgi:uncharacterized protein YecE (DUF72 family)